MTLAGQAPANTPGAAGSAGWNPLDTLQLDALVSACALVASLITVITLILLPLVWRGGRRVDSWANGRKFAFTLTVLVYGALGLLLLRWGALAPWSA